MKLSKKFIASIVTVVFAFTSVTPAFAQTVLIPQGEGTPQVTMMDASEMDMSVPEELVGMDRFLSTNAQGCIQLDKEAALAAGYTEQAVLGVKEHLDSMNEQVLAGKMYIDNEFTGHGIVDPQKTKATSDLEFHYKYGYSGIETYWYGATFIYFNT